MRYAIACVILAACAFPRPDDVPGGGDDVPNIAPTVRGIESVPGSGMYRSSVTSRDVQTYTVLFDDPDPDQEHTFTWFVTAGTDPKSTDMRPAPIDFKQVGSGSWNLFVDVSDGIETGRGGPFPITVSDFAAHVDTFDANNAMQVQYSQTIVLDGFGAMYLGGYFYDRVSLSPDGSQIVTTGNPGIWLSKLDFQERFVYGATWPGQGQMAGLAIDDQQNVYFSGSYTGVIDMNPGSAVDNSVDTGGSYGAMLVKMDRNGNYAWGRSLKASSTFALFEVKQAGTAVYAIGYMIGTADLDPGPGVMMHTGTGTPNPASAVLYKFDLDGNMIWVRPFGQPAQPYGYHIAIAPDGSIVCSGNISGTADFDPGPGSTVLSATGGGGGTYVVSFDADGNFKYGFSIGGMASASYDLINSVAIASDGSFFVTGYFQTTSVDFDPGAVVASLSNQGVGDAFVAKYNPNGTFAWVRGIQGTSHEVTMGLVLHDGDVIVSGNFRGAVDLDPTAGVSMHTPPTNNVPSTFAIRLGSDGSFKWASSWGGSDSTETGFWGPLAVGSYLYLFGYFQGTTDFDPGSGVANKTSLGQSSYLQMLAADTGTWTPGP